MTVSNPKDFEVARVIVRAVFTELGLDVTSPTTMIEAQKDFAFLRRWRTLSEKYQWLVLSTVIGILISSVLFLMARGLVMIL